jgi:hypothetical protein
VSLEYRAWAKSLWWWLRCPKHMCWWTQSGSEILNMGKFVKAVTLGTGIYVGHGMILALDPRRHTVAPFWGSAQQLLSLSEELLA